MRLVGLYVRAHRTDRIMLNPTGRGLYRQFRIGSNQNIDWFERRHPKAFVFPDRWHWRGARS